MSAEWTAGSALVRNDRNCFLSSRDTGRLVQLLLADLVLAGLQLPAV